MLTQTYTIPNRFGLRAVLLIMAIFAIVFAFTRAVQADLRVVAPVLSFVVLVCLGQMAFGRIPRTASALMGGIVFPVSAYIDPLFDGRWRLQPVSPLDLFWLITCGLLAGYLGGVLLAGLFLVADCLRETRGRVYAMPTKFGTGTMLLATTLFAMVFAFMKWANARPWELFFFTSFVATVCISQMFLPRSPRWASALAGGIFLPLSIACYGRIGRRWMLPRDEVSLMVTLAVVGLLVGYLGGTLIAGVFLISDFAMKLLKSGRVAVTRKMVPQEEPMKGGTLTLLAEQAVASRQKTS